MIEAEDVSNDERLRRLEAVADATLSRLDVADLLDELLDRVCDLLDVDTAVILLMDAHTKQLVATASRGLEEEVRQGFRVAVGQGFAGRVAADKAPVQIHEIGPGDVASPQLLQKGVRSLLGVPMFAGGDVIGVLHVGSFTPRHFSEEDVHLLELVADRAGLASRARANRIDQTAAAALQRSLLPTRLPRVPGMEMAVRYVPGHAVGIGGDWVDVFILPSGSVGVVVGDVSGHGLASAVVMGRIRSALRSYALISEDPAEVLTLLDRKVQHFEAGSLTTAIYAVISPGSGRFQISVAGHLLPILATPSPPSPPSRPGVPLSVPVDPPLGTGGRLPIRRRTAGELPPGAVLVCYTDGLVERRGELIDVGIARLAELVRAGSADEVCGTIMTSMAAQQPTDDIALLTITRLLRTDPG